MVEVEQIIASKPARTTFEPRLKLIGNTFLNWVDTDDNWDAEPTAKKRSQSFSGYVTYTASQAPALEVTSGHGTLQCRRKSRRPPSLQFVKAGLRAQGQGGADPDDLACPTASTRCPDVWCLDDIAGETPTTPAEVWSLCREDEAALTAVVEPESEAMGMPTVQESYSADEGDDSRQDSASYEACTEGSDIAQLEPKEAEPLQEQETAPLQEQEAAPLQERQVTTLMIQNLPTTLTQRGLVSALDQCGFIGLYDFLYLPTAFGLGGSRGYAFVNFTTPAAARRLACMWDRHRPFGRSTGKALHVIAAVLQGRDANIARWNTAKMRRVRNPEHQPLVNLEPEWSGQLALMNTPAAVPERPRNQLQPVSEQWLRVQQPLQQEQWPSRRQQLQQPQQPQQLQQVQQAQQPQQPQWQRQRQWQRKRCLAKARFSTA